MTKLLRSGERRYLATNATDTAFSSLVGRFALGASGSFVFSNGVFVPTSALTTDGVVIPIPEGFRGVRLKPFGAGSDNQTFSLNVSAASFGFPASALNPNTPQSIADAVEVELMALGGLACTMSTGVGVSGSVLIGSSERVCDTLVWTVADESTTSPRGPMTAWQTAFALGTATAYSPANNTQGHLTIPDLGGAGGIFVDFDMTGATSANFLYEFLA